MALKVVPIGGGTGNYSLLRALRRLDDVEATAIVSMADSGGSSGRLRDALGALPPGDILQCLLALSQLPGDVARTLLRHRFSRGKHQGDTAGNWLLTVLHQTSGSFIEAIEYLEEILQVKGRVLPVTVGNITLHGRSQQGTEVSDEANFDQLDKLLAPDDRINEVWLEPNAFVLGEVVHALVEADYIVLTPGDLWSSVIPVLLVNGVREALARSRAPLIYVCNLVTTRGQTDGYTVNDFVRTFERYLPRRIDTVLYHVLGIDEGRRQRYAETDKAYPVAPPEMYDLAGRQVIGADLLASGDLVRHDETRLAVMLGTVVGAHLRTREAA